MIIRSSFSLVPEPPASDRKARRAWRKAHRLCVECGARLTNVDAKRQLCARHAAKSQEYTRRYKASHPENTLKWQRITNARIKADRTGRNKTRRELYHRHKQETLCVRCWRTPLPDHNECWKHHKAGNRASREYRRRRSTKR